MANEAGSNHVLSFGKYKGKTILQVLEKDPSYIIWLNDNKILNIEEQIVEEAIELKYEEEDDYRGIDYADIH